MLVLLVQETEKYEMTPGVMFLIPRISGSAAVALTFVIELPGEGGRLTDTRNSLLGFRNMKIQNTCLMCHKPLYTKLN
jgi:hypothetical protein